MEVTREMEIDLIHRQDLSITSAAGATFLSEARTERRLTESYHRFLTDAVQS